ncbi:hypothetical protein LIA77_08134 [Sarocladium implicatum]|nr:hypothetical protein LIA77_08134 [Sarocladium implicatum]
MDTDHASDKHNLMARLAELRRYEFAARYGNYFAHVCKQVKRTARLEQTSYFSQITGWNQLWTDITEAINQEEDKWMQYRFHDRTVTREQVKTTLAVYEASVAIGLDFKDIKACIALYPDRNSLFHTSIDNLIRMGEFGEMKRILARDLQDLPLVTPKHLAEQIPLVQQVIESIIDQYFTRDPNRPNDSFWWNPKVETLLPEPRMQQHPNQQTQVISEAHLSAMREAIQDRAAKRYETVHQASMAHLAPASHLPPKSPSPTRPRSSDDPATGPPAKKATLIDEQKAAWNHLVNLQLQVNKKLHEYRDQYRTIEAPIDPLLWFDTTESEPDQPEDDQEAGSSLPER